MLGLSARRKRVKADEVVSRARTYPSGDYRRWKILAELSTIDGRIVFGEASRLVGARDPESMTLAAEILDGLFLDRANRDRFAQVGEALLSGLCQPDQYPAVLAAALHPYSMLCSSADDLFLGLLDHPDARVRRSATQLVAVSRAPSADGQLVSALVRLLGQDPDAEVREEAAEGLNFIFDENDQWKQQIAEALAAHRDDPLPGIRIAAIRTAPATDASQILSMLTAELSAWEVDWQFVSACGRAAPRDEVTHDVRTRARQALLRLQEQDWAQRAVPNRYPLADERARMLADAIAAVSS